MQRGYTRRAAKRTVKAEMGTAIIPAAIIARGDSSYPTLHVREQSLTIFPNPKARPIKNAGRTARISFKDSDFFSREDGDSRLLCTDKAYLQRIKKTRRRIKKLLRKAPLPFGMNIWDIL